MRKVIALLATFFVALTCLLGVGTSAIANDSGSICLEENKRTGECEVWIDPGPSDPGGPDEEDAGDNNNPSGPAICNDMFTGKEVPCSRGGMPWISYLNCYVEYADPQEDPPAGMTEEDGAWYSCYSATCAEDTGELELPPEYCNSPLWLESRPAGLTISPEEAAEAVSVRLPISAIDIGMAPQENPEWGHRRTHVGVPVWMWVANPTAETYDGYEVSDSEEGMTVTGRVEVSSLEWNMGDGQTVVCGTAGQAYQESFGWAESPDCGHLYSVTSTSQPGDRYTVTATSRWEFHWEADGQTGVIELDVETSTPVEVNEMQTVNVSPNG